MKTNTANWVVGHKITAHETTGDYDLTIIETPPNVQGPPPHTHQSYKESFVIIEGEMEFFIDGAIQVAKAGDVIDIPPNTLHTFSNKQDQTCRFVNIHSPKGFRRFFEEMGVPETEDNSRERSTAPEAVQALIQSAASYDMHIAV